MARSYSEALKQLMGAVLMPVTPVATEGHAEACSLGYHLRAAMLVSEDRAAAGAILTCMAGAVMCGHGCLGQDGRVGLCLGPWHCCNWGL